MKIPLTLALGMLSVAASAARANLLINGSLESAIAPQQPDNLVYMTPSLHSNALTGWTMDSGSIDVVPGSYFQSSLGTYSVDLVGTPGIGSISQQVTTISANLYTLTFDFAINPQHGPVINEGNDTKMMRVEAIGQDGVTVIAFQDFSGTRGTRTTANMQWAQKTFSFTADGTVATIRLRALAPLNMPAGLTSGTIYTGPVIDNLDLEAGGGGSVPEPASLSLLGVGGGALLLRRRRRGLDSR